jgi:hypothetical protein
MLPVVWGCGSFHRPAFGNLSMCLQRTYIELLWYCNVEGGGFGPLKETDVSELFPG